MWFSFRLGRHLRLGLPWPIAIIAAPFTLLGLAILLILNIAFWAVWLVIMGIAWVAVWIGHLGDKPPRQRPSTPRGDSQFRFEIHIHEDSSGARSDNRAFGAIRAC
jgi:hypothetical protein